MASSNRDPDRQRHGLAADVRQWASASPASHPPPPRLDTQHTPDIRSIPLFPLEDRSTMNAPIQPESPTTVTPPSRIASPLFYGRERQGSPHLPHRETKSHHSLHLSSKSHMGSRGSEKASFEHRSPRSQHSLSSRTHHTSVVYEDVDIDGEDRQKVHVTWILVYLSFLAPLLALTACIYSVLASTLILVSLPLALCISRHPLQIQFKRLLQPPLRMQLGLIFSVCEVESTESGTATMLVLVNLFAPFYACGIMLIAWIAAGFWFFAVILGEPNKKRGEVEKDEKDDGRMTVLYVSYWWEAWLKMGLQ